MPIANVKTTHCGKFVACSISESSIPIFDFFEFISKMPYIYRLPLQCLDVMYLYFLNSPCAASYASWEKPFFSRYLSGSCTSSLRVLIFEPSSMILRSFMADSWAPIAQVPDLQLI